MNTSAQNRRFLERHFPDVLAAIDKAEDLGLKVSEARKGGLTMHLGEAAIHSAYDPAKETAKVFRKDSAEVHIHFGFGLGHLLQADTEARQIIIYEPVPAILAETIKHVDLKRLIDPQRTALTCDLTTFKAHAHQRIRGDASCRIIANPFHANHIPNAFKALEKVAREIIEQATIALRSIEKHATPLTLAALKSLALSAACPSVASLKDCLKGKPAVIVSAGPSLDKNLCDLAPYADKVTIIAMGRTAKPLERYGIKPHFLVHNEPQPFFSFIEDCDNLAETAFVLAGQAQGAYYRHAHAHTFVYHNVVNFTSRWLAERFPKLPIINLDTGGSVANEAFSLATLMACDPIVLIGQDLALKGGRYYGHGESNKAFVHSSADNRLAAGYFGETVQTVSTYASFAHWFADAAAKHKQEAPEARLYNATEGGILLPNFQNRSLRDIAQEFFVESLPIARILELASKTKRSSQLYPADIRKLLSDGLKRCSAIKTLADDFEAWAKPLLANQTAELADLRAYDQAKDTYVDLLRDFSVLSGCMQGELLALNRKKRLQPPPANPQAAAYGEIEHFCETLAACKAAVARIQPVLAQSLAT